MNMHICDESEYCIGITRVEPKHSCVRVSGWTYITYLYQACSLTPLKASTTVTFNQSPAYPAFLNSDRTKNNFLSSNVKSLAGMFSAGKDRYKKNRRSSIGTCSIAQRHEVFENRTLDLKIVN